ncbi:MAG: universal stress protein [Bacteroidales bacterium]|nr:universal stress protein [Lentimicrobiaceae bacterium]MDD5695006.1 universal stress protein [Bacteroidales bacterium]
MKNIILVPTDFSEVCNNAIKQASVTAQILKYGICLLHVINKDTRAYLDKSYLGDSAIGDMLDKKANEIHLKYKVPVETRVVEGSIFKTIGAVATEIDATLMFLGTHGKVGMQKLTGSFALKVITRSPIPVIVVHNRSSRKGFINIVMPVTSESGPMEKTKWAAFIAQQYGATIHIFQTDTVDCNVVEAAKRMNDYFKINDVKHTYNIAVRSSGFSKSVIDYATSLDADLILIMTNPDSNFKKFFLGTYDEEMIFNAPQIPVMCINPRKFKYPILER